MRFCSLLAFAALAAAQPGSDVLIHQVFDEDVHGWTVMGQAGSIQVTHDRSQARGKGALAFTYEVRPRQITAAVLPATPEFARMKRIRFWARTDHDTAVGVILNEQAPGGHYSAWFWSPANTWQQIELSPADFAIGDGPQDPPDPDGKLDVDRLAGLGIVDLSQVFGNAPPNPDPPIIINRPTGSHTLLLDEFEVLSSPTAPRSAKIDRFDRGFLQWMTLGGMRLRPAGPENPLHGPALEASYEQIEGQLQVLVRSLANLDLSRAQRLAFDIASEHESTLILSFELKKPGASNGPRFSMTIYPPGGREAFHVDLKLSDFEGPGKLDPAQIKSLTLVDVTASTGGAPQTNRIWIGNVDMP